MRVFKGVFRRDLEMLVLVACYAIGRESSASDITVFLRTHFDEEIAVGTLYNTLHRLDKKGLLESKEDESANADARKKFLFRVTEIGHNALKDVKRKSSALVKHLPSDNDDDAGTTEETPVLAPAR